MDGRPFNDYSYEQFLSEGKIMGSRCRKCGFLALPPRPICVSCFGSEMDWVEFQGEGRLVAFTSTFVAPPFMAEEGFGKRNPYVVGVVELKEGAKIVARIAGVDARNPEKIKVGTSLKADFVRKADEGSKETTLVFKP